jgi:hypothetical protein
MIPKIQTRGGSFKGLATYLTHDPKEKTDARVDWTHTLNLANDHIPSAVDEMLWTARYAELLKQEAGIRAGGRSTENVVKHFSLNWSPEDEPNRERMIEATEAFLRHLKWNEHQAVLVAHNDKEYAHVHVMLNAIHPETGLRLNESFEHRRAQAWALDYEKEHGRIYCEQRLKEAQEREEGPTRPAWMAFKENQIKFEREEKTLRDQAPIVVDTPNIPEGGVDAEWKKLKLIQRHEREVFFSEGKLAFSELRNSIYREVREEFRDRWADFYAAQKTGGGEDALALAKAELVADQKAVLDARRDEACKELRKGRDGRYRELLDDQRDIRFDLRARQAAGFENDLFFHLIDDGSFRAGRSGFVPTTSEVTARQDSNVQQPAFSAFGRHGVRDNSRMKSGIDIGSNIGIGLGFGVIDFLGSIANGLIGSTPDPKPRQVEAQPIDADPFDNLVEEAAKRHQTEREEADREWRNKQRSYGD